ncbi:MULTISPECIES: ABC transporter ATP-binding protein [unclassified Pseudoclavibacter]|uniref:ABC transporter ATP-binding protein n=1 Tax=unclassified Pseudoclavibacter TaxID=2615177 RepID=UPI0012F1016C|nr:MULTISPECIES: ABC transporter ATP-binding protein [unclassified Pseudoclavibacter]MBF4458192.1 ABC transporter ATP-binding protein [Pseudoclavibacter sp. VKM Ac-2867]VXC13326.1 Multidrug ABC transporter ATP-binding protein [Pseudoclavibacter sp. 8L]
MTSNGDVPARRAAVIVSGLRVERGRATVFDGLDLSIPSGQITGLLGPSGCGKTTLMRAIVGVQKTAGGTVTVLGEPAGSRQLRSRVSYATQSASVYDDLTVAQNLSSFASILGSRRADVAAVIDRVGLRGQAKQRVESLSGGQKNRVSLAVAMLGDPEVLVLDEPTVGLDPVLREELWALFRSLADGGATLLVSSHVMDEAMRCDRLILMRDGQVVADTTPPELLRATGTSDADAAFLALIQRDDHRGRHAGAEEGAAS